MSPTATLNIPTELRTAFKQYLAYFNDYMMATRGADVGLEVRTIEDGLELEIRKSGGLNLDQIDDYLQEYLGFIKENLDKLEVEFEMPTDPTDQKITMVELRGHVRHLRQTVETRNVRVELLERLVKDKDKYLTLFASKSDTYQLISQSSSVSNAAAIAKADAEATALTTATLSVELPKLQEALEDLREEADTPALKEAQDLADKIPPGADKEKVIESGVMPKLKRLVERGMDAETKLGKVVKSAESGVKNLQKVGKAYNAIAEWTGMPTVPRALLGKGDKKKGEPKP